MPITMDFSDVLAEFKTGTYTVTRRSARTLVKGRATLPSNASVSISAAVQPLAGRDTQVLPEGVRASETITIYTDVELIAADSTHEADLISYKGDSYEVRHVERQDDLGVGVAFKAIAVRL